MFTVIITNISTNGNMDLVESSMHLELGHYRNITMIGGDGIPQLRDSCPFSLPY